MNAHKTKAYLLLSIISNCHVVRLKGKLIQQVSFSIGEFFILTTHSSRDRLPSTLTESSPCIDDLRDFVDALV